MGLAHTRAADEQHLLGALMLMGSDMLNLNNLLTNHVSPTKVSDMGNLANVHKMRYTFNACSSLIEPDFSRLDPSKPTSLSYAFSGSSALGTIWVAAGRGLPPGVVTTQTFCGGTSPIGEAEAACPGSETAGTHLRIDGSAGIPDDEKEIVTDAPPACAELDAGHFRRVTPCIRARNRELYSTQSYLLFTPDALNRAPSINLFCDVICRSTAASLAAKASSASSVSFFRSLISMGIR